MIDIDAIKDHLDGFAEDGECVEEILTQDAPALLREVVRLRSGARGLLRQHSRYMSGDLVERGDIPVSELRDLLNDDGERDPDDGRPFTDLRDEGILWAINVHVFHPRGFALALHFDDETGEATGWSITGDGSEPWMFADDATTAAAFNAFRSLLVEAGKVDVPGFEQDAPEWTLS